MLPGALPSSPAPAGTAAPALGRNQEPLAEIFSYQGKTWVALNPLILPVGQELELLLEPKGGRGQNQQRNLEIFKIGPSCLLPFRPSQGSCRGAAV